jgi:hypothetical protein
MKIEQRLKLALANLKDDVFLRQEFDRYASKACVAKGLKSLTNEGVLVKLGKGIYAKGKVSILSGQTIPTRPIEVLAPLALIKMGISVGTSKSVSAYNSGKTTQIPAGLVIAVGNSRVTRQIRFGSQFVTYEKNKPSTS